MKIGFGLRLSQDSSARKGHGLGVAEKLWFCFCFEGVRLVAAP